MVEVPGVGSGDLNASRKALRMPLEGFAQGSGVFRFVLEQAHSLAVWRKVRAEAGVGQ